MARKFSCLVHLVVLSGLWACHVGPQADGPAGLAAGTARIPDRNLLIITLDTTRADRLGAYGFKDVETPNLDRLAREGVLFRQALTVAPLTLPSHASLFTGRNPPGHGVRDNGGMRLASSQTTLAEIVRNGGFRTGAFVASSVLEAARGLDQGFDTYADEFGQTKAVKPDARHLQLPANRVVTRAIDWINHVGPSRFFAWVHLYDPHAPYDPPEPYKSAYAARPYLGEIAFMDAQIGRLVGFLETRGLLDRTAVIVIGDHGESLGDHGEASHGLFVYEAVLRVPFIVRAPSIHGGPREIESVTRTIDVLSTALDLIGLPAQGVVDGASLAPLMTGAADDLRLDAYAESMYPHYRFGWSALHSLRSGHLKLIDAPRPELYDVARDPGETENLYESRPRVVESMTARLRSLAGNAQLAPQAPAAIDRAATERLRALGYVGTLAAGGARNTRAPLADPKDKLVLYNRITRARLPGGYE